MNTLIIIILSLIFIAICSSWYKRKENSKEHYKDEENELLWDVVYEKKSPLQKIEFLKRDEDNTFVLLLNDEIQVHSNEYKISHNLQCSVPIEKYKPKKILILGGGDLIAASFCLKHDFVESVTLVEIDSEVVKFAKENETFKKITQNVSKDKRLSIEIGDAIEYIEKTNEKFDFIIEDVEIDFTTQKSEINKTKFLKNCLEKCKIYCGSIPDHSIKKDSKIIEHAKWNKDPKFIKLVSNNEKNQFLSDLKFDKKDLKLLKSLIETSNISICSYDYGDIYGIEAYLLITQN
tara:strand:- start:22499 stop:23371 length:873 start_codon:yes stop_codon:yes gene_type:complete